MMRGATLLICFLAAGVSAQEAGSGERYLVVPFDHARGEIGLRWLGEAAGVVLADELLLRGVPVVSRDGRVRALERLGVPTTVPLSHASVIRLGQIVRATHAILGTFDVHEGVLTVRVRVIHLETGRLLPETVESGPLGDLFAVHERIVDRIVPGRTLPAGAAVGRPPVAAYEQYIKGLIAESPVAKMAFLRQALAIWPAFERPRLALWAVQTDLGAHADALRSVEEVRFDHPLARQARFRAALSQLWLGRHDEAFETLLALNEASPDAALLNNLGVVQLRRPAGAGGATAVAYFAEAARLDGQDPDLYFNLGYAHWLAGDTAAAITWLREAARRNPADAEVHQVLGLVLRSVGAAAEAARELELARWLSSAYEDSGSLSVERGLERVKTELDLDGTRRLDHVIIESERRHQRELAVFHLEAGKRLFEQDRNADALAEFRRAAYLAPYDGEAHRLIGRALLRSGRVREAVDALQVAVWSDDTIEARLLLAEALIEAGALPAAARELDAASRLDPDHPDIARLRERL